MKLHNIVGALGLLGRRRRGRMDQRGAGGTMRLDLFRDDDLQPVFGP
jgi:hypothetical protein